MADAVDYTVNSSPASTDYLLGIDNPAGSWAVNNFTLASLFTLFVTTILTAVLPAYTKTMTGDETFTYGGGTNRKYLLNPNGADRAFNPSGTFPAGFEAIVINTGGPYDIIFDDYGSFSGSGQVVTPGNVGRFIYTGSEWV